MTSELFAGLPQALIESFEQIGRTAISPSIPAGGHRLTPRDYAQSLGALADRPEEAVALYVHLPFCPVRCLYCACQTTITHDARKIDHYLDTLEREIELVTERLGSGRPLSRLHLGGGTPNYLTDSQLIRLMGMIERRFEVGSDTASTIECAPRRTSAGQLELLRGLGFRGLSFGIQDLDARVQHAIGRINSLGLVRDVVATARDTGFECISLDLIYGLPNQTLQSFGSTLERTIEMAPDRVRCFSYSHQPALQPHQYAIAGTSLPGSAQKLSLLHQAAGTFTESGYEWIGMDTFVRPGDALADARAAGTLSHSPLGYTPQPIRHLIPVGSSSLGEVDGALLQNEPLPAAWRKAVEADRLPIRCGVRLSDADQQRRLALQHLLCHLELPARLAGCLDQDDRCLRHYAEHGLLEIDDRGVRVTPRGRFFLHGLCTQQEPALAWGNNPGAIPRIG